MTNENSSNRKKKHKRSESEKRNQRARKARKLQDHGTNQEGEISVKSKHVAVERFSAPWASLASITPPDPQASPERQYSEEPVPKTLSSAQQLCSQLCVKDTILIIQRTFENALDSEDPVAVRALLEFASNALISLLGDLCGVNDASG
jgi:hypothetical protein